MRSAILIPKKIRVGFQNREDTYTKKLAYVIYYDHKGKLRKEASWNSWRDTKIEPEEYDNVPTEGFVLNKKVGGYAGDWGNFRQAYVRVYDPRGFEFEITVPNLLYILEHTSSIKGKGLEGEFVYAWSGTDLLLLPTCAPDYSRLQEINERRAQIEIKNADLKIGATYLTKQDTEWVYMGYFDTYDTCYLFDGKKFTNYRKMERYAYDNNLNLYHEKYEGYSVRRATLNYEEIQDCIGKQHFFYYRYQSGSYVHESFEHIKSVNGRFIDVVSEGPALNYAELFEKLEHDTSYSPIDKDKCVFRCCTPEEVDEMHLESGGKHYTTVVNGTPIYIEVYLKDQNNPDTGYTVFCQTKEHNDLLKTVLNYTEERLNYWPYHRGGFSPLPLNKLLEILPPYCTERYLKNGKFYDRRSIHYE